MSTEVIVLGARGSVPVSGKAFMHYGGSTTCIFLRMGGQVIILDAGTGILNLPEVLEEENRITILMSHSHVDHLLGLPMCRTVFDPEKTIDIYGAAQNGLDIRQQTGALMAPPLWPVKPEQLRARIAFHDLSDHMMLGQVSVDTMEGNHPGGVTLYRLNADGKSVVIMTDCTLVEELLPAMTEFARGCDLLLCDGQYSQQEWEIKKSFGHNTWNMAAEFGAACGADKVRIIHHDPNRTDEELDRAAAELSAIHGDCMFACENERIIL